MINVEITVQELLLREPPNTKFYRLTNQDEKHYSFQYQDGLNVDTFPFNPTGECSAGGLYFFSEHQLWLYKMYTQNIVWIREIDWSQTPDARIYAELHKYKADKLFLKPREKFDPNTINQTPESYLAVVTHYGEAIKYVKDQTPELCLAAVTQDGRVLQYVKNQTPESCLVAVKQYGYMLQYVKDQTEEICLAAVTQDGLALRYVKDQTPEVCLAAVTQNGDALYYMKDQTPEICLAAVTHNGRALRFVKDPTPELRLAAVKQNVKTH